MVTSLATASFIFYGQLVFLDDLDRLGVNI